MKKYIRTKENFVCEEISGKWYRVINMGAWNEIKIDFEFEANAERILKQADSIEDLCDEFVVVYKNSRNHINYMEFEWALDKAERSETEYELYGAIWTEKGLIYVAKLNKNG